ncbi:MAG: hypothetical protein OXI92_00650 [Acidobacteriota bacterium]|nr:hypothetical protein [Acidobacteriota bacterium]
MRFTTLFSIQLRRCKFRIALVCLMTLTATLGGVIEAPAQDLAGDRSALVALYNATNGRNWHKSDRWLTHRPVSGWHGVTVSNGRVTGLSLGSNRLTGTVPPELGDLSSLTELNLSNNQLTGAIPPELGNLSNLTRLSLTNNQLTGNVPMELGDLSSLTQLELAYNRLAGAIPPELGNLSSLTGLHLSANRLVGAIPAELGNLSQLRRINLFNNQLTGTIPTELGNLSSLTYLALSFNQLTGAIPPELGNLSNLTQLHLASNRLTGTVPAGLGNLASLQQLVLSNNQLMGTIPSELTRLRSLRYFYFRLNPGLCIQDDSAIRTWLAGVGNFLGANCSPSVRLAVEPTSLVEGSATDVTVTATRKQVANEATVILTFGGSAKEDEDYTFSGEQEIIIAADKAAGTTTLTFEPVADALQEGNEIILVEASIDDQVEGSATLTLSDMNTGEPFPAGHASFVPVVLTSAGLHDSYFTSEMTLTNRGVEEVGILYNYTAAGGGGSGGATETLAPGKQKIVPNAIDHLRTLGVPIPGSGNRIGTLRLEASDSNLGVTVRTTTRVADGRAGLAYPGIAVVDGFTEAVYLCGLRQDRQDRSNVAVQNAGTPEEGNITLRITVYSGDPDAPGSHVLPDVTLAPGGFRQLNGILATAAFPQGYVKVERVEGTAPFYGYGVINDNFNSDGSFVFPITESSLVGTSGQTLPVIIETGAFQSELTLTNFSASDKQVDFSFVADAVETRDNSATFSLTLKAGEQSILPHFVSRLRQEGVAGIGPAGRAFVGALFAAPAKGDMSGIVIGARTGSPDNRGGQYSLFYNGVPYGSASVESVWIYGLQQNEENRSNLALVNTGEIDGSSSTFEITIYDGGGESEPRTKSVTLGPRLWTQENGILGDIRQGYVQVQKTSGNNPFIAYGVINDGGKPGERSGDGAFLPAQE